MKLIFLDIDGVLNSRKYDLKRGRDDGNIDLTRLELIKELVDRTEARIVLSSSWRAFWKPDEENEINATFARCGLKIFDKTDMIGNRTDEIRDYLVRHSVNGGFVIIDDSPFGWAEMQDRVVRTSYFVGFGLEREHVERAIAILNGE